jgi:hypothetical protein
MSIIRAWYAYNETLPGGNLNSTNYFYLSFLPSCQPTETQVCCVYGAYNDGTNPPYGDHPAAFSSTLESYIKSAFALTTYIPNTNGNKRYVYVHVID